MFLNYSLLKTCFYLYQVIYFSEVLGLTCSLLIAVVIHTGISETDMHIIWGFRRRPCHLCLNLHICLPRFDFQYQIAVVKLRPVVWLLLHDSFTFFTPGLEKCKRSLHSCLGGEGAGATRRDSWICTCIIVCVLHWQLPAPPQILFVASLSQDGGQQSLFEHYIPPHLPLQTRTQITQCTKPWDNYTPQKYFRRIST